MRKTANNIGLFIISYIFLLFANACELVVPVAPANGFTTSDELALGQEIHQLLLTDTIYGAVLSPAEYPFAYNYLAGLRAIVLGSGQIQHFSDFSWNFYILYNDDARDMFSTAGGYVYITTGMLKYLTSENQLLNLMAHEVAYVDNRINKDVLLEQYFFAEILDAARGGNETVLAGIKSDLKNLAYTLPQVGMADSFAVRVVCPTPYDAAGMGDFLKQLGNEPIEWHKRHPSPDKSTQRIDDIYFYENQQGCSGQLQKTEVYQSFLKNLP